MSAQPARILFVAQDACSPHIAASLLRQLTGGNVFVETAHTRPQEHPDRSDEMLVAMGLNPAEDQRLTARALRTADRVVSLDTDLDVARLPGPRYEEWDLDRDDLGSLVQTLSDELSTPVTTSSRSTTMDRLRRLITRHRAD